MTTLSTVKGQRWNLHSVEEKARICVNWHVKYVATGMSKADTEACKRLLFLFPRWKVLSH